MLNAQCLMMAKKNKIQMGMKLLILAFLLSTLTFCAPDPNQDRIDVCNKQ